MMKHDLLEQLAHLAGAPYLSELHGPMGKAGIVQALAQIAPEDYDLAEWEKAVGYVLGQSGLHFATSEEAAGYLCQQLLQLEH